MRQYRHGWLAVLTGCVLMTGCQGPASHVARTPPPAENSPKLSSAQKADVQFALARSLEKSGELGQASAMYQDVLKKDPRRADALDRLAVIHARQDKFEQAIHLHRQALALQPTNADFHCNLGYCYYLQKRWAEAELALQKAIELAPHHQRAHNNLGLVLAHTERSQQAFASFRRAGCSDADAHNNLAFVLTLTNSWAEAKEHYARARELGPSTPATDHGLRVVTARLQEPQTPQAPPSSPSPGPVIQQSPGPAAPLSAAPIIGTVTFEQPAVLGPATANSPSPPPANNDAGQAPRKITLQGPIPTEPAPTTSDLETTPSALPAPPAATDNTSSSLP